MSRQEFWSTAKQDRPPVSWDGRTGTFSIVLNTVGNGNGDGVEAEWIPPITYIVRFRKAGDNKWSIGFVTPLTGCGLVDLEPDTEYEIEIRAKNEHGESDPLLAKVRTDALGTVGI